MRLRQIISGGQTGADQAGLRAAKILGVATGGWMPRQFMTETGSRPEFRELYGMRATGKDRRYATRTRLNVRDADATVWFGRPDSRGYETTRSAVTEFAKPAMHLLDPEQDVASAANSLSAYLRMTNCEVLNIAGHRESTSPGIGEFAETILLRALGALKP